jgi:hypothetical protein
LPSNLHVLCCGYAPTQLRRMSRHNITGSYSPKCLEEKFSEVHPVSKLSHLAVFGSQCSGIGI